MTAASPLQVRDAVAALARHVADLDWDALAPTTRDRAVDVVLDTLGVTLAGARTPELRALQATVPDASGPNRPVGTALRLGPDTAAWLDGTAACCLELDEGHKAARGHPAAHVVPALLATSRTTAMDGPGFLTALVAGHEVATRLGAATFLHPGVHPHGTVGAAGAAAAVAKAAGLDADGIAGAIDAATTSPIATTFSTALDGSFARNTWVGQANTTGIGAARLAAAGLADLRGRAADSLGTVLGHLDVDLLRVDPTGAPSIETGYFKRHASCAYTHTAIDAALALRADGLRSTEVRDVVVDIHRLGLILDRTEVPTRLAAMFSLPYTVAVALVRGHLDVEASGQEARRDPELGRLVAATALRHEPAFDADLSRRRPARVTVTLHDGSRRTAEATNPVGDADHRPFTRDDIRAKLAGILPESDVAAVAAVAEDLAVARSAAQALERLPDG